MKKLIASLLIAATFQASAAGFVDGIVVANGATLSGQTSITGSADVPQLLLRANASQTQAIAKISNSTGLTDYFRINADGTIYFNDSVTAPSFIGTLTGYATNALLANSALALQTARAINGTNFDGTSNITVPVNTTSVANNASFYPIFVSSTANGNQSVLLGSGLSFNPSSNNLATTTFTGALSGNADTATTATNATNIAVTNVTTDATMYPLFSSATSGNTGAKISSTRLTFNPLSGLLSSTGIINSDTWMQSDVFRQSGNTTSLSFNNTGSNSAANSIGITSTSGGITLTSAGNKDVTLATSGTGKTSVVDLTASGTITGNLTGTATNANNVATTNNSTNATFYPVFAPTTTSGNQALSTGAGLSFNPATALLTANALKSTSNTMTLGSGSKTLQVTDNSVINQDVSTTASPTFAGQNLTGVLNFPAADGNKILLLNSTTCARIIHSAGWNIDYTSGCQSTVNSGAFNWFTINAAGADTSRMTLSNAGVLAVTGNETINNGKQVVNAIASANLTGQTSTVASIAAYTPSSTGTFDISGYIRCTAYTSGTIQLQVTYTDETGTAQTNVIPLVNTSGTPVTGANTGGMWSAMPRTIRANTSTAITVKTVGTFGATYDVGAYIHQAS